MSEAAVVSSMSEAAVVSSSSLLSLSCPQMIALKGVKDVRDVVRSVLPKEQSKSNV